MASVTHHCPGKSQSLLARAGTNGRKVAHWPVSRRTRKRLSGSEVEELDGRVQEQASTWAEGGIAFEGGN